MKISGACAAAALTGEAPASESSYHRLAPDRTGVLIDLTLCVGCRRCEWACNNANRLPNEPLESFDDPSVFTTRRRPSSNQFTVVNRWPANPVETDDEKNPAYLKVQCMHCEKPSCVSACLVGAMRKDPRGPVIYDASRCIGCRYCMVACPFQYAAYEYDEPLTPRVRKCTLCRERTREGQVPACVEICPVEALLFGERSELLEIAHERIRRHPDRYIDHVYGEHEAGGTSWLFLSDRPFSEVGLPALESESPAELSEAIQHGIFKAFAAPVLLSGLLFALGKLSHSEPSPE